MSKDDFKKVQKLNESEQKMMTDVTLSEELDLTEQEKIEGGGHEDEEATCNFCSPII